MSMKTFGCLIVVGILLTGCSSMGVFKDSPEPSSAEPTAKVETLEPEMDAKPQSVSKGQLSASQIRKIISGKSWKWTSPKFNGVTLYADDGSALIEVTGKGTTTGKWRAEDGKLCESTSPAPFLPEGSPEKCRPMSGSGNTYSVGQATFTLA
jgi:Protein of unknown function (DUF995)